MPLVLRSEVAWQDRTPFNTINAAKPLAVDYTDGTTFELSPSVLLAPPWSNKYSLMLQYIGIVSNDKYSAYSGGVFKGKSIFLMQFQYSFDFIRGRS